MTGPMIQGTACGVAKSTFVAGLGRLLAGDGVRVAPFKPQNISNNAAVTLDGAQRRARAVQALACGVEPVADMNPVLIQPEADERAQLILLLGGARSGKSRRAEVLAAGHAGEVVYLATAPCLERDAEWAARIAAHRARRPTGWRTVEEEVALVESLTREAAPGRLVVVECATTWLANLLHHRLDAAAAVACIAGRLEGLPGTIVVVANEVGAGIVPESPLSRHFRDLAGLLNQRLAAVADRVEWLVAGIPVVVKGDRP